MCIRALKRNAFAAYVSFPRQCSTVLYSTQDRYRSLHKLFAGSSLISHSTNFNLFQLLQIVRQKLFPEVLFRWVSWFFPVKSKAIKIMLGICTCVLSFQTWKPRRATFIFSFYMAESLFGLKSKLWFVFASDSKPTAVPANSVGICSSSPHHHNKYSAKELDLQTDLCEVARIQLLLL